ncbi:MAG: BCAM0308 family protein [bacterium]
MKKNPQNKRFSKADREPTDESLDPYLNEQPDFEPARCSVCGNIYRNKQWYHPEIVNDVVKEMKMKTATCPGCKKVQDRYYYGEVKASGDFMFEHREEISHLIENEIQRAQKKNPLEKLVAAKAAEGEVLFRTTNGKLAERLGRALEKAYQGELKQEKSGNVTRVWWKRES